MRPETQAAPLACLLSVWVVLLAALSGTTLASAPAPVSALGRLEPLGGIVHVAAPYSTQGPSILAELMVAEGQSVTNAQPLARTHTHVAMLAAWRSSLCAVESARARLAQVRAGLKPAEIATLHAEAEQERADLADAARDLERVSGLRGQGVVSERGLEEARTRFLTKSNAVEAAAQRIAAGREVREVDVAVALAGVAEAEAQAVRTLAEWEQTVVRAPHSGQVLTIHTRVGELVGSDGLLDLGRTDQMTVKAEVYESDIHEVRAGQPAEVTGEALTGRLLGRVMSIARQVKPNRLLHPDPSAFTDARVIEVIVRLDDGKSAAALNGALVTVHFLP